MWLQSEIYSKWSFNGTKIKLGAVTLCINVVQDIFVAWSREAGVVNTAGVDSSLVLFLHDKLDLTPLAVEAIMVRERSKVCDSANLLSVIPGPLQVHIWRVEVLHSTAENQQSLHLGDLRDAGDLEKWWLHWRYWGEREVLLNHVRFIHRRTITKYSFIGPICWKYNFRSSLTGGYHGFVTWKQDQQNIHTGEVILCNMS